MSRVLQIVQDLSDDTVRDDYVMRPLGRCEECGIQLTLEEDHYLEDLCVSCEDDFSERLQRWRDGNPDEELNKLYFSRKKSQRA